MADKIERTAVWKGLNRMPYIGDGEMRNMKNLSSDAYPYLTTRKGRVPYTFAIKIPSPEGEAYRDIERLPEPTQEEDGNIYKITTDATEPEYASGEFYYYKGDAWVKGRIVPLEGTTSAAGTDWLVSESYKNGYNVSAGNYPKYASNDNLGYCKYYTSTTWYYSALTSRNVEGYDTSYKYRGYTVKYIGEDTERFKKGKTYVYTMYVRAYWKAGDYSSHTYSVSEMPIADADRATKPSIYRYQGETTEEFTNMTRYECVVDSYCVWEECEGQYDIVEAMPEEPTENQQVRFISRSYGAPMQKKYYLSECDADNDGELIYFYSNPTSAEVYTEVGYLPQADAENKETCFKYTGPTTAGEFARCYYNVSFHDWEVIEHPKVERIVTLKDYLDNYDGSGLTEILEIGSLNGNLAALIKNNAGEVKLYYKKKLYGNINDLTEQSGKKLVSVGNRLVVGESGSYIYEKDGKIEFFQMPGTFAYTVPAKKRSYGGNFDAKDKTLYSSVSGSSQNAKFFICGEVYRPGKGEINPNGMLEKLAESLNTPGMGFVAYGSRPENSKKQYLKLKSVNFVKEKFLFGYSGHEEYNEYTTTIEINAEGVEESFDWHIEERYDDITFESTDPHYYDVVAWKKRLWGYSDNVLHGTVADIFDKDGVVDWNTGDNTQTEAISQPLWQGGNITGLAALMEGLVYFKEDNIAVVQGNYPAIMSSNTIPCRGLPSENRRSVAVGNESVYYLGRNGVMRFGGGLPQCISTNARITGSEAVGATDGNKYWLSIKENNGDYALYVYDITYGLWHKEDNIKVSSFTVLNGNMHMAVETDVYNLNGTEEETDWECELWYDEGTHRRKKYKQIDIRGDVGDCELWLKADDDEWRYIGTPHKGSIKLMPFDCVELSLKLKGKGKCEIKSIDRTYEVVL